MKKKVFATVLAGMMALSLTACGNEAKDGTKPSKDEFSTALADQLAAALGIHLRLQNEHLHALLFVVVGHLHQRGAFAAVHGTVSEV